MKKTQTFGCFFHWNTEKTQLKIENVQVTHPRPTDQNVEKVLKVDNKDQ
jgi:hypothetical protein